MLKHFTEKNLRGPGNHGIIIHIFIIIVVNEPVTQCLPEDSKCNHGQPDTKARYPPAFVPSGRASGGIGIGRGLVAAHFRLI